ncbi:MAG: asparagine synthase-related protein, partial [Candidatus Micrarchaeaceae archaeon]
IEKSLLREAFDVVNSATGRPYLPKEILWRQKEQFSDGVGYKWIDSLKQLAEREVTDKEFKMANERFPERTPTSKEQYYYRTIFEELFHNKSAILTVPVGPSVACSTPRAMRWDEKFITMNDPSGRAVIGIHKDAL